MKTKILLCILMLLGQFCFGQNLVLNPSFEQYDTCPDNSTQLNRATYWFSANDEIAGSAEYFNSCDNLGLFGVPNNYFCVQNARTSYGYSGIDCYNYGNSYPFEYREYIEGTLKYPLVSNHQYCVSLYVSLADKVSSYGIDALGLYFTNDSLITDSVYVHSVIPQIANNTMNIIIDTINWVKISGTFIAAGGERFFTFGNFRHNNQTNYIHINTYVNGYAYYLLDDVAVYECDAPVYTANAGGNKTICKGESVQIGMPRYDEYLYEWHSMDGALVDTTNYITVSPAATTSYVLNVKDFKFDVTTDTVTVVVDDACHTLYAPNIFSPNGDGLNDVFRVRGEQIASVHLQVYNRWGNMVFESNDMSYAWDGMFQGKACEVGVYAWMAEIVMKNGTNLFRKGNVSLVR